MRVYHFALPTRGLFRNTAVHMERVLQRTHLDYTDLLTLLCESYTELGWERDLDRSLATHYVARFARQGTYQPKLIESLLIVLECGQSNLREWLEIAQDHWQLPELTAVVPKRWLSPNALLVELHV